MKLRTIFNLGARLLLLSCLGMSGRASANTPPYSQILDLMATQEGQDVVIDIGIAYDGTWGVGQLTRAAESNDDALVLATRTEFQLVESRTSTFCAWNPYPESALPEYQWCAENPDACEDCNGDGTPDCVACEPANYYRYRDECVRPGRYTYTWNYPAIVNEQSVDIDVADVDDESCDMDTYSTDPVDGDVPEADGNDADAGDDSLHAGEGNKGSCSAVVAQQKGRLLPVLLALVGVR